MTKRGSQKPGTPDTSGGESEVPDTGASARTSGEAVLGAARPDVPMSPQRPDVPRSPQRPSVPETTPRPRKATSAKPKPRASTGVYEQPVDEDALKVEAPSPASFRTVRDLISDRVHGYARERRADEMEVERRAAHWKRNRALAVLAVGIAITFALHVFGLFVALDESPGGVATAPGVREIVASIPPSNPGSQASVEEARVAEESLQQASGVIQLDAEDGTTTVAGVGVPGLGEDSGESSDEPLSADERIAELLRRADELIEQGAVESKVLPVPENAPAAAVSTQSDIALAKTYPVESSETTMALAKTYPVETAPVESVIVETTPVEISTVETVTVETAAIVAPPIVETIPDSQPVPQTVEESTVAANTTATAEVVAAVEQPTAPVVAKPTPEELRDERVADLLGRAESHLERRRLTTPANDNAYDLFLSALALDAGNESALAGIDAIHSQYVSWAKQAEGAGQREKALANYEKALGVNPEDINTIRRIAALSAPVVQLASARPAATDIKVAANAPAKTPTNTSTVALPSSDSQQVTPAMRVARMELDKRGLVADAYTLLEGADHGDYDSVKLLLESGMSPDLRAGKYGFSPLILAAIRGDTGIVSLLLQRGAQVDMRSKDGRTALMAAAWNGHDSIVQSLLAAGSSPDVANQDGWTAMHYAAWQGHVEIVGSLIDRGADPGRRNSDGWDVAQTAEQQGFIRVMELIQARGNG